LNAQLNRVKTPAEPEKVQAMKTYMLLMLMSIFVFVSYLPMPREAESRRAVLRRPLRIHSLQLAALRLDHFEVGSILSREIARKRSLEAKRSEQMKLNSEMVDRTLSQIDAQAISEDHPLVPRLKTMFGDHTFFINASGLNIIERLKERPQRGTLLNVASWDDTKEGTLIARDEPESTDVTVELEPTH
jgi:hypothetical protein